MLPQQAAGIGRSSAVQHQRQRHTPAKAAQAQELAAVPAQPPQAVNRLECSHVDLLQELPPCPQVQELYLRQKSVQLGCTTLPASQQLHSSNSEGEKAGVLQAVQQLTRLDLYSCRPYDSVDSVAAALAQLPSLQHLSMDQCDELLTQSGVVLAGVTKLTH
jgi:hypothetical protein